MSYELPLIGDCLTARTSALCPETAIHHHGADRPLPRLLTMVGMFDGEGLGDRVS
jgi:hypothetical protein